MRIATPSPTVFESVRRSGFFSLVASNSRFPLPRTTGKTISRSSSTRSFSTSVCTSCALPWTTMSPCSSSLSFATSPGTSPPLITVELSQSGFSSVVETTYLGILLNLSANSPSRDGQAAAKPFPISVQAVSQHLKVLERAGLITRSRTAQLRPSRLHGAPLKDAAEWLDGYRRFWEGSFDRLEARLRGNG